MAAQDSSDDDLAKQLDDLAHQCRSLWSAWEVVAAGLGSAAPAESPAALYADAFAREHPTVTSNLGWASGQLSTRFVAGMGAHVLTLAALIDQRQLRLSEWAVIRAELEMGGRVAWLIGPLKDGSWPTSDSRVARVLMELLADGRRHVRAAEARRDTTARNAYREGVSKVEQDLDTVFPGWDLQSIPENPDLPAWELRGEKHVGLSAGVKLFADLSFGRAPGLYDAFSILAHPSWISLDVVLTTNHDIDGVTHSFYVLQIEDLSNLVRLACLSFYKAAHLAADYFHIDKTPLETWADGAPPSWFSEAD